jgi:hypothetical protein
MRPPRWQHLADTHCQHMAKQSPVCTRSAPAPYCRTSRTRTPGHAATLTGLARFRRGAVYGQTVGDSLVADPPEHRCYTELAAACQVSLALIPMVRELTSFLGSESFMADPPTISGRDACRMFAAHKTIANFDSDLTGALATVVLDNEEFSPAARLVLRNCVVECTSAETRRALFADVARHVQPLVTLFKLELLALHGQTEDSVKLPLTVALCDKTTWDVYALDFQGSVALLLDVVHHAGDTVLFKQVAFLRDVHCILAAASVVCSRVLLSPTPDDRELTDAVLKSVNGLQHKLHLLRTGDDVRTLFQSDEDIDANDIVFKDLYGVVDGAAMKAEVLRQVGSPRLLLPHSLHINSGARLKTNCFPP